MLPDDLVQRGQHVLTVCNACRYCEQVLPGVSGAREATDVRGRRSHVSGEPVPQLRRVPVCLSVRAAARIRHQRADRCSPKCDRVRTRRTPGRPRSAGRFAATPFAPALLRWHSSSRCWCSRRRASARRSWSSDGSADFYGVIPHGAMVTTLRCGVALRADRAGDLGTCDSGATRRRHGRARLRDWPGAVRDALTLRHLHGSGLDCASNLEVRLPWRRWFHHCTFYGFLLCFASTTVAAIYHSVFGWQAPYAYSSLPVLLGAAGGFGLLVGPLGLAALGQTRDPALGHDESRGLDAVFLALLFLTSLTGLALLVLRHSA